MKSPDSSVPSRDAIALAAAQWVLRHERGLTAHEQDEFSQWLAADPRHGEALALHRWGWSELDRLAGLQTSLGALPDPDLFAPRRAFRVRTAWYLAAAAAGLAILVLGLGRKPPMPAAAPIAPAAGGTPFLAAPLQRQDLADGSTIELNRGAQVEAHLTPAERRITLVRGEASFQVAKDPSRPFIVTAGGVEVRAVGTIFNVRLEQASVEVVVSEGKVNVTPPAIDGKPAAAPAPLAGGQRARIGLPSAIAPGALQVDGLSSAALAQRLAWQARLLDFTDAPLAEIVAEFNRRNPVRLTLADPSLAELRLSAAFRSDNVEGFVRLMESDFGMRAEWSENGVIALRRAR